MIEKVKEFIDRISDDQYTDAREAISGVVAQKYQERIASAREKLGLKLEEGKKCNECGKLSEECKCKAEEEE